MTIPVVRQSTQSLLMFERLTMDMGLSHGDQFTACRRLLALIETVAPHLPEADRTQLARLVSSTGHAILLTCSDKRA
jgi:hypothetical protein